MVEMAEVGAPIRLDGVAVHPDCWCVCLCYRHFAPENPETAKYTFWYRLTRVVPDKVQRAIKWFCVCGNGKLGIICVASFPSEVSWQINKVGEFMLEIHFSVNPAMLMPSVL